MIAMLLLRKIVQLFVIMVIGFFLAKLKLVKSSESGILSKCTLYLFVPAAIINAFDFEMSGTLGQGLLLAFAAAFAIHLLFFVLDGACSRFVGDDCVSRASVLYPNSGTLIIPIVTSVLGADWVVYSTAFLSVQVLFLWTHGVRMFSGERKIQWKKIVLNTNILAIVLGLVLLLGGWRLPAFAKEITTSFSGMVGPVSMLLAGILAADIDVKQVLSDKKIYLVSLLRLLVFPLITIVLLKVMALLPVVNSSEILLISFLACMAPSAATVMQFAQLKNRNASLAVSVHIVTTVLSVATMPLLVALYQGI